MSANANDAPFSAKRVRLSNEASSSLASAEWSIDRDILINENRYLKKRLTDNLTELATKDETISRLRTEIEALKNLQKNEHLKGDIKWCLNLEIWIL